MNIAQILSEAARSHPTDIAVEDIGSGERLTYEELRRRTAHTCRLLVEAGLSAGDRVALLMRNSPDYIVGFFAVLANGMVVVPLNVRLTNDDFTHMLRDSGARWILIDDEFRTRLEPADVLHGIGAFTPPLHSLRHTEARDRRRRRRSSFQPDVHQRNDRDAQGRHPHAPILVGSQPGGTVGPRVPTRRPHPPPSSHSPTVPGFWCSRRLPPEERTSYTEPSTLPGSRPPLLTAASPAPSLSRR